HHGSGLWTYRIQGCGAIDPRPKSGLPSARQPDRSKRGGVLEAVKVWPGKDGACCKVGVTANLDGSCARRLAMLRVGAKKRAFRSNKETGEGQKGGVQGRSSLTKNAPYKNAPYKAQSYGRAPTPSPGNPDRSLREAANEALRRCVIVLARRLAARRGGTAGGQRAAAQRAGTARDAAVQPVLPRLPHQTAGDQP